MMLGFSGCASRQPDTYIQALEAEVSYFDLLFHKHGGFTFRHHGEDAHVYLAQYRRDEQVLHERVGGLGTMGVHTFEGTILWGVTTEGDEPSELRTIVAVDGAWSQKSFDLSVIDFDFAGFTSAGVSTEREEIEVGRRYALYHWQSGSVVWTPGDVFDPERLRENENTLILYVIFE